MDPQNNQPPQSPERMPQPQTGQPEQLPSAPTPEAAPPPRDVPTNNGGAPAAPKLSAADVAAAIAKTPAQTSAGPAATPTVPLPASAADQDLIEPEWVNKAEQVVSQTAGNPYAEEEGVENLQVDYLKKRYGHEVKKSEDK